MKKIPTLFERVGKLCIDKPNPEADVAWVLNGEGYATRKWDGTACLWKHGKLYKRLEWAEGKGEPPPGFLHHSFDMTVKHGHGWIPVGDGPEDRWHREGLVADVDDLIEEQTYELVGPKINSNADAFDHHHLIPHGQSIISHPLVSEGPRSFESIRAYLTENEIEGIVFWRTLNAPCDMVKIKRRDFGLPWPIKRNVVSA